MTAITASANIIQTEETDFRSPDSENLKTRMGASINYSLKRNAQLLECNGMGQHKLSRISGWQGFKFIRRASIVNSYVLSNQINGSANSISVNAEIYDESGVSLGNLFSIAPSINSAIAPPATEQPFSIGRYVEESQDINAGVNKVVGVLNFTELQEGYYLRFFLEDVQDEGYGFNFQLWLRETA